MKVAFFGAHPDDIEPQAGGTIARLVENGHTVTIVIATITGGGISGIRTEESVAAAEILGAKVIHLGFDQRDFRFERSVVQKIDSVISEIEPDEVYTCWEYDSHQDHQTVAKAVISAARKNNFSLYFYEPVIPGGLTPHEFECNYYVDISSVMDKKLLSVLAHSSQVEKYGTDWVEAVKARSRLRGFQINVMYAEAFKVIKLINKLER